MITLQDAKEILYQVKYNTGIRFSTSENDLANLLVIMAGVYNLNKEEILDNYILSVHECSRKQHFNWN